MPKLSVCIAMLGKDLPFTERMAVAAATGMEAVEFWGYKDLDIAGVQEAKTRLGIEVSVHTGGGNIVQPGSERAFVEQVQASLGVAQQLECKRLLVTTGNELEHISREEQYDSIVRCLQAAATVVESAGVTLVLEPLNVLVNHKGYFLSSSREGFAIVDAVASPNVKLLYDVYHQQITEGNLIATIQENIERIGHFHIADVPGRLEPGTGEINYANVLRAIDEVGYTGYVGLEYQHHGDLEGSLRRVRALIS